MNRRELLRSAAYPVAGSALGVAVALPAPARASGEDPELIRLGEAFADVAARHAEALARKVKAVADYRATEPPLPNGLAIAPGDPPQVRGERLLDVERRVVWYGSRPGPRVPSAQDVREALDGVDRRTIVGRRLVEKLRLAEVYEAQVGAAREAAGVDVAYIALDAAEMDALRLLKSMFQIPARTTEGLRIKAEVFAAMSAIEPFGSHMRYGEQLAREVAAVIGAGATS